ncbi:helix-turn-helix domain-containing protein [Actinomadura geliboluensis]|uniref:Helix-turn-helix transcriptional regulator n=1 Tax=Actinomadura geliboluensis TaxID=882440 RepID=A0A5S4G9W6_9ACTN|nr:XRE family transcriptional regulator [Actinomadura geliboluensis]TMR29639.1 helix-turn-helix transcriptional regulator [Actinomadura geliboluensis]
MAQSTSSEAGTPPLRLRECRERGALTLSEAAERIGVSITHLSRLERGQRQPSIGVLLQLAALYRVGVGELVGETFPAAYKLVRAGSAELRHGDDGIYSTLSGAAGLSGLEVIQLDAAGKGAKKSAHHSDEEWIYVVSGWVDMELGDERIVLKVGDSIHFDARTQHRLTDSDPAGTRLIIVSVPLHPTRRQGRF